MPYIVFPPFFEKYFFSRDLLVQRYKRYNRYSVGVVAVPLLYRCHSFIGYQLGRETIFDFLKTEKWWETTMGN